MEKNKKLLYLDSLNSTPNNRKVLKSLNSSYNVIEVENEEDYLEFSKSILESVVTEEGYSDDLIIFSFNPKKVEKVLKIGSTSYNLIPYYVTIFEEEFKDLIHKFGEENKDIMLPKYKISNSPSR
jgi:hypothetical protein